MADDVYSICDSLQTLQSRLSKCRDCCSGNFVSYHCILCPVEKFKPNRLRKVENHLNVHWKTRVQGRNGLFSVVCHLPHITNESKRHYHCPSCGKVYKSRKGNLEKHVRVCRNDDESDNSDINQQPDVMPDNTTHGSDNDSLVDPTDSHNQAVDDGSQNDRTPTDTSHLDHSYGKKLQTSNSVKSQSERRKRCHVCNKYFAVNWIRNHMRIHRKKEKVIDKNRHHFTVAIDLKKGIYSSATSLNGPRHPKHMRKTTCGTEQISFCENMLCRNMKEAVGRGSNLSFECPHIQSIRYAIRGECVDLLTATLTELLDRNIITETKFTQVINQKRHAEQNDSPFVVRIPNDENTSNRYVFLSIYTENVRYWSLLQRTVSTYDVQANKITCRCSDGKRYCPHKVIVKWYLYQEMNEIYTDDMDQLTDDENDIKTYSEEPIRSKPEENSISLQTVNYWRSHKLIPSEVNENQEFQYNKFEWSTRELPDLIPPEDRCVDCGSGLDCNAVRNTQIVFMDGIDTVARLFEKKCQGCNRIYRYQEWKDGVHNFNNRLLLGLDVCKFIRSGLQNHIAIGRSICVLEDLLGTSLNQHEMENAYLHYEAFCEHSYDFYCIMCGYHPSIIIWDAFRKAVFRYPVSDLQMPRVDDINENVNVKHFWKDVEDSLLMEGCNAGKTNPRVVPSFEYWAPWIGQKSRKDDYAFNTEFRKCSSTTEDEINEPMPEETLLHLLNDEKTYLTRKVASAMCGVLPETHWSITKGESVIEDQNLATLYSDIIEPKLREVIEIRGGSTEYHSPHWRHIRWVNGISLAYHLEMRKNIDGENEREKLFSEEAWKELHALVLESFAVFKKKTKIRIGYFHGYYLCLKDTKNRKLLQTLENEMAQNLNSGYSYFVDVLFVEAQLLIASHFRGITLQQADEILFPHPHDKYK